MRRIRPTFDSESIASRDAPAYTPAMKHILLLNIALAAATVYAQDQPSCSNSTLNGNYGYVISGVRPSSAGGPLEQFVGSLIRRFDGAGNFTQIDNIHGAISGWVADRPGKGTYSVNADCSGAGKLQIPGVAFEPEDRFVVVDDGNGIIGASTLPAPLLVTHTARRTSKHPAQKESEAAAAKEIEQIQKTVKAIAQRLGLAL